MAKKSKKLKIKKLQINLTNRWLYTLIVFFSLVVIGVFVYATTPNPGHDITQIAPPSVCGDNQFLKWTGTAWACADVTTTYTETDPIWIADKTNVAFINKANTFGAFNQIFDTNTLFIDSVNDRIGIGTITPDYKLDVNRIVRADLFSGDGSGLMNIIVRVTPINDVCTENNDGMMRYRQDACDGDVYHSYLEICMKWDDSSYYWYPLHTYAYGDCSTESNGTGGGGGSCFLSGTKVLMADRSYKEIQDIQSGDLVTSYDLINNAPAVSIVKQLLIHPDTEEEYLIVNNKLKVTPNHNMWVVNRQLWQQMHFINIGDILLDSDGKEVIIYSIDRVKNTTNTVYNLHLGKSYNNYFAEDILVHNVKWTEEVGACPPGQFYYWCIGGTVHRSGCYVSQPLNCYR